MHGNSLQQSTDESTFGTSSREIQTRIRSGIETPLHALRAALEAMGKDFPAEAQQSRSLERALALIDKVDRNVQVLASLASPGDLTPLRCTLDELARSAVRATTSSVRERVYFAVESPDVFTKVDGPCFSRWLSHLIQASVARQGEALLRAQVEDGDAVFTLVSRPYFEDESQGGLPDAPVRRADDELLLQVAEQEIRRMGGTFELMAISRGTTQVKARLPLESRIEGAA